MVKGKNQYNSSYEYICEVEEYCGVVRFMSEKTQRTYFSSIDRFFDYLQIKSLDDIRAITPKVCREYQTYLKESGLQSTSINTHNRNLRAFFNWFAENGHIEVSPFEKVKNIKEPKKEKAYLTGAEIAQFMSVCKKITDKFMFAMFLQLAIREDELVQMQLADIRNIGTDDKPVMVIQIHGKGSKERVVAWPSEDNNLFADYMEWRNKRYGTDIPYVFVSTRGGYYSGNAILKKFKRIAKRAGFSDERIKELHVHSLRHTWLAKWLEDGNDMKSAQVILGHSQMATTANIYAHFSNSAVINAMKNQKSIV